MFSNLLNIILIPGFMSNEKEAIHRQSGTKLSQLLHAPGICVYLNQDNSWHAAGLHDACVAQDQ